MVGAQAEGCAPVADAFRAGTFNVRPVRPKTIAKSLAIGDPADGYYALKIVEETGGAHESVNDAEIIEGIRLLASTEGIFAETAGGVSVGVLKKLTEAGKIDPEELVVVYITGNGLKTVEAVAEHVRPALHVKPSLTAFQAAWDAEPST
jgi:threonine synthase